MSEKIIKRDLIKELDLIPATDFESICFELIKKKHPDENVVHNGINIDDRPVKSTLDVNSGDLGICLECSVEKDYFIDNGYKKIEHDLQHISKLSGGNLKKVYLCCSKVEPPSFRAAWIKSNPYKNYKNYNIDILDGKKIVDEIYEYSIQRGSMYDFFGRYLPKFKENMERETYFENVPQLNSNYVEDQSILSNLVEHIQKTNITVISGISGSGKTQLAVFYCKNNNEKYDNIFWLSGEDLRDDGFLNNIKRGGTNINIVSIFNEDKIKTLLVIDDYNRELDENKFNCLFNGCASGSRILITSQLSLNNDYYFHLPSFSESVALKILGDESDRAKIIVSRINLPIVLNAIKSIHDVEDVSYSEIYDDLSKYLDQLTDSNCEKILDRILSRYANKRELSLIANILNAKFDVVLLKKFLSSIPFANLRKASFLVFENNNTICTIHDFLKNCLQDANESESFIAFISKYLDEKSGVMDEYVLRQIHIAFNPLKQIVLAQEESLNWITYALLQKETDASKCDIYRNLAEKQFTPELTLENICCLLEAKEAFNYDHAKEDKQILEKYEEELKTALAVYSNPVIKKHLHHHLGKTQRRIKKFEQAIEQFGHVLKIESDCFPAYGQIMKCTRKKDEYKSEYIDAAKKILGAIRDKNEKLPLRTALALISDLRSGDLREVYSDQKELCVLFKSLILKAAYDGMNQFYEAFVAFVNFFSYPEILSKECLDLYNRIPMLKYISLESINRANYANALDAFSVIYGLLDEDDLRKEKIRIFIKQVVKEIESSEKSYEIRSALKAMYKCGFYQDVVEFDINESVKNDLWVLLWLAKAKIELKDPSCLESIEMALGKNLPLGKYEATFYQCKAKSLQINQKIDDAKMWYTKAIDACSNGAFKTSLQKELDGLG